MLNKEDLQFLLEITDYFHGHWEDPEWGKRPINQVLILLSAHTLTNGINDQKTRGTLQSAISKRLANDINSVFSTQDPIPPMPLSKIMDYLRSNWGNQGWAKTPINQLLILLSAHTLANGIVDEKIRGALQSAISNGLADAVKAVSLSQDPESV